MQHLLISVAGLQFSSRFSNHLLLYSEYFVSLLHCIERFFELSDLTIRLGIQKLASPNCQICNATKAVITGCCLAFAKFFCFGETRGGCLERRNMEDKFYPGVMHRCRSRRRVLCSPRRVASLLLSLIDSGSNSRSEGALYVTYSTGLFTTGPFLSGINLQHRTTPREWYCINDFADTLSRIILRDLHVPPPPSGFTSKAKKLLRTNNHKRQQLIAPRLTLVSQSALSHGSIASLLEATASRLEQVIMREAFSSAFLLLRPKSPPLPLSSRPPPRHTLVRFAQDVASQVMQKACQSAKKRMRSIQMVADSVLCSLVTVTSLDFHSTMVNATPTLFDDEESVDAIIVDHSPCFGPPYRSRSQRTLLICLSVRSYTYLKTQRKLSFCSSALRIV
ncbi:hypothetical protein TcWFU_001600 [Taenia crassiceps]|uniref:Uncharacterized protein n=1 Tax=Taenia crassiceps TaxID=6207 RepID=A0ABR4QQP9_9CEST